jgi:hypothetical protein
MFQLNDRMILQIPADANTKNAKRKWVSAANSGAPVSDPAL